MRQIELANVAMLVVLGTGCGGSVITAASAQTLAAAVVSTAPSSADRISEALDTRGYRLDGAKHFYALYADRIYQGKLPALIHAVVVIEIELDSQGRVVQTQFVRVPSHAPDVAHAVRDMIQQASPLPVPARMGGIKYTEIWLVDKSGRFQLDALTEGQRGE